MPSTIFRRYFKILNEDAGCLSANIDNIVSTIHIYGHYIFCIQCIECIGHRVSNLSPLKIRKTHEHTEGFRMAIDSVKRSVPEINARSSRSPGPLFDISVMHVVTAVVIRDRV